MAETKQALKKQQLQVPLDPGGIDRLSQLLAGALDQIAVDRKEVLRLRLALEDLLALWLRQLDPGTQCTFRCGTRLGRMYIEILAPGRRADPAEAGEEEGLLFSNLLAQAGLSPVYTYSGGRNQLGFYPRRKPRLGSIAQLLLAIGAAVVCGLIGTHLPQESQAAVSAVVDPLFSAMMGLLQTLASPMIFLSVCWGIVGIGDVQVLGKVGRTVIGRFILMMFLVTILVAVGLVWVFMPEGGTVAEGSNAAAQIYSMILGILPTNLLSPFVEGNSLQIIFLAVCTGLTLLVLGEKVPVLRSVVEQVNLTIQTMLEVLCRFLPLFTFISLLSLLFSDALSGLGGMVKGMTLSIAACVVLPLVYALVASLRLKVSPKILLHKQLPAYLIALTTASSSAALSTNLETCERQLGIAARISRFAVPLGQVIFKTGGTVAFLLLAMGLAEFYNVAMPPSWVVTGILVAVLVAIATPPIPGGYLSGYTVLLAQLGIPDAAIALAVAANVILDFFMTSCGVACLQSELLLSSHKLGMLDLDTLRKPAGTKADK